MVGGIVNGVCRGTYKPVVLELLMLPTSRYSKELSGTWSFNQLDIKVLLWQAGH